MNRKQNSIITRAKRILAVCTKFVVIVTTNVKFKALVDDLTEQVDSANGLKDDQALNIKGYAIKKGNFKADSVKQALVASGVIQVFAKDTGDDVLLKEMKLVKTSFEVNGESCLSLLRIVQNAFKINLLALNDYGLTNDMFTSYSANVDGFETELNGPAGARGHKHYDTEGLETELEATEIVMDDMAKLMETQATLNPEFYIEFQSANTKGVLGGHKHRDPKIPVGYFVVVLRNKNTGDVIVEGLVKKVGDEEVYTTTKTGTPVIESEQGVISCKATAIDFNPITFTVTVTNVQQTITILLTPVA